MAHINAVKIGAALAVTVGIAYSACTLVFWLWPEAAATFMNALFHGLDFRKLQSGPMLFDFGSFLYALAVMMVWSFALGAIFSWIHGRFRDVKSPARRGGLRLGDVIRSISGKAVADAAELVSQTGNSKPGKTVNLQVERRGERIALDIKLGQRPVLRPMEQLADR
ncbi:DUF5676 family membrane protein [Rhodoferax sp.]|uniref:DUF5676 family membrane protein n=1 Tax=Rhodoferax sp. TaxID=50421 RepID=UPI001EBC35E7|nr:DUF5676 family membrane protein [Rhodoferax sp.]MBT9508657.1 PDZ domain-containing protein [Rhodoferax sp.]